MPLAPKKPATQTQSDTEVLPIATVTVFAGQIEQNAGPGEPCKKKMVKHGNYFKSITLVLLSSAHHTIDPCAGKTSRTSALERADTVRTQPRGMAIM